MTAKAKIRYDGRFGWEEPTTSTDYEDRGYWSVYTAVFLEDTVRRHSLHDYTSTT